MHIKPTLKFIDLFAGIGGFRTGFTNAGYECIFSSEINTSAQTTYSINYQEIPYGDVRSIKGDLIDNFDILIAGFPCQPFSISGHKKGFEDTRGTLFFEICRLVKEKNPNVIVLENVKHLLHHNKGETFDVILESLKSLGYLVSWKILNASNFSVPQSRERIIIVANNKGLHFDFNLMNISPAQTMRNYLDKEGDFEYLNPTEYTLIPSPIRQKSGLIFNGYLNKNLRKNGVLPNSEHMSRAHKQNNRIYSVDGIHPTISSQESSGRFYIYFPCTGKVRKLTIQECYRFMGFPDSFIRSGSLSNQYKQIGNSVCIPMIEEIANQVKLQLLMPRR